MLDISLGSPTTKVSDTLPYSDTLKRWLTPSRWYAAEEKELQSDS